MILHALPSFALPLLVPALLTLGLGTAAAAEGPAPADKAVVSNDAVKLAGLVRFVAESCPGTKPTTPGSARWWNGSAPISRRSPTASR